MLVPRLADDRGDMGVLKYGGSVNGEGTKAAGAHMGLVKVPPEALKDRDEWNAFLKDWPKKDIAGNGYGGHQSHWVDDVGGHADE